MTPGRTASTLGVVFLALMCAAFWGALAAAGQDATETESMRSTNDATIREVAPDRNFGDRALLVADASRPALKAQSALIEWDLSGIPPGTKIDSATVTVSVTDPSPETFEA